MLTQQLGEVGKDDVDAEVRETVSWAMVSGITEVSLSIDDFTFHRKLLVSLLAK